MRNEPARPRTRPATSHTPQTPLSSSPQQSPQPIDHDKDTMPCAPSSLPQPLWEQPSQSHVVSTLNHLLTEGGREEWCLVDPQVTWQSKQQEVHLSFELAPPQPNPQPSSQPNPQPNPPTSHQLGQKDSHLLNPSTFLLAINTQTKGYRCTLTPENKIIEETVEECRQRVLQQKASLFVFIEKVISKIAQLKEAQFQSINPELLFDQKIAEIHRQLLSKPGGLLCTDLLISLLSCSMRCYRRSTLISCFHDHFSQENARQTDFSRAQQALKELPALKSLCEVQDDSDVKEQYQTLKSLPESSIILLQWILSSKARFKKVEVQNYFSMFSSNTSTSSDSKQAVSPKLHRSKQHLLGHEVLPDYQFDAILPQDPLFDELCEQQGQFIAFHGSPTENWHSILRKGLQNKSNTEEMATGAAFGEGIYFSDDLVVSQLYSKPSECWSKSQLGSKLSVVGVYKIANDPRAVQTQRKSKQNSKLKSEVPEKYHIVKDSSYVRLQSLLIWKTNRSAQKRANSHSYTVILAYVVLLVALVLFQVDWRRMKKIVWRFFMR